MTTFHEQLTELLPRVRRFCYALTANQADGDDLLQVTVEKVLTKKSAYDTQQRLDSWVLKIAKNTWIDELRKRSKHLGDVSIDEQHQATISDTSDVVSQSELTDIVLRTMAQLPENQRLVAYYVLIEGYSYKEVATELSIPVGTVMSSLARARTKLVNIVSEVGES
jgi:RNA polymerase sigma-70 factor (ECF subfamily)